MAERWTTDPVPQESRPKDEQGSGMELVPEVAATPMERVLGMQIQAFNQLVEQQLQLLGARRAEPTLSIAPSAPVPSIGTQASAPAPVPIQPAAPGPAAAPDSRVATPAPPSLPGTAGVKPAAALTGRGAAEARSVRFSLAFSGASTDEFWPLQYDLLFEIARFADRRGFNALWISESHFHPSRSLSPNPSVLAAALARETERIALRAGSVLLPLHHPVRVAEEWALVDNLSGGRIGLAFAAGHPGDFALAPETCVHRADSLFELAETVRCLWRGETVGLRDGAGTEVDLGIFPLPSRRDLPMWIRAVNEPEICRLAGEMGAGVLTDLAGQTPEELTVNL